MKLIEFTRPDGEKIWLDPVGVGAVEPAHKGSSETYITMLPDTAARRVVGKAADVAALVNAAKADAAAPRDTMMRLTDTHGDPCVIDAAMVVAIGTDASDTFTQIHIREQVGRPFSVLDRAAAVIAARDAALGHGVPDAPAKDGGSDE